VSDSLAEGKRRAQALGKRSYPVLVCNECFGVTGWLDAQGRCDTCLRRALLEAAYRDPHGGWVAAEDNRPVGSTPPRVSLRRRVEQFRHPRRALAQAWMTRVRPDENGPIDPEDGYQLEVAKREEVEAADGSGLIVRFRTATAMFRFGRWVELESTRLAHSDVSVPAEFSAGLPVEQLLDAWGDYKAAVDAFNCRSWAAQSATRDAHRQADAARRDALREQRDVGKLLDEG
jgi:hypothetical protein